MIGPVREALGLIGRQFGHTDEIELATYRRAFRLSVMDPFEPLLLPPLLNLIVERAPGITIEGVLPRPEFAQDILSGTLDLVCFAYPIVSPDFSVVPICPVDIVMIARRNHPAIGKTLDVDTMNALGFIALAIELRSMTQVDRELLVHGIKRRVVMSAARMWSMPALVAQTDLVATLPRAFAAYCAQNFDLAIHDLPVRVAEQHMYMMWHSKMEGDAGHKWLRETLQATARERLGTIAPPPQNVAPFVRPPRPRSA
jgi:DNA-binding transcriptional LysR family regulator